MNRSTRTPFKPILLCGSKVWGPYTDFDYTKWDVNKIDMTPTRFVKRALGSNIMARGEVGAMPLLIEKINRVISHVNNIKDRENMSGRILFATENCGKSESNIFWEIQKYNILRKIPVQS